MSFNVLDEEVTVIREKIEKVEEIVEKWLIGVEEPSQDEEKAIRD